MHGPQAKQEARKAAEGVGADFPVFWTDSSAWEAVTAIDQIQPSVRPTSQAKIQEAKVRGR
jgi:hypothetical protein